jgi:GNAT superfamily N-acetyltransferase
MNETRDKIILRNTSPDDFSGITEMTRKVYPGSVPWSEIQLASHLDIFPEGQFVAVESDTQLIVGMAASLIIFWDDYDVTSSWRDFTDRGMFTNHDAERGRTLYGAEVIVTPQKQGGGIGKKLYAARREMVERLGLRRIRAGARLRGYHKHAQSLSAEDYAIKVVKGELYDPTLSFQLNQGFQVLAVISDYLRNDPESLGHAAIIEWLNENVPQPDDSARRDPRFISHSANEPKL